jgi:hypothetical protein
VPAVEPARLPAAIAEIGQLLERLAQYDSQLLVLAIGDEDEAPLLDDTIDLYRGQQLMDVLLEYPIASDILGFEIRTRFDRLALRVATYLRVLTPEGAERAFELHGGSGPVGLVRLASGTIRRWAGVAHRTQRAR